MPELSELGIVLVDDHPIVRDGLQRLFENTPGFAVLAACGDCGAGLTAIRRHRPAIVLLDAQLPDRDGIGALAEIAAISPASAVVIFTATLDAPRASAALHAGAKAVLLKTTPAEQILATIRAVADGTAGIAPESVAALPPEPQRPTPADRAGLSPREREIAELVARGARNKEIAFVLCLAEGTVKLHIYRAFKKLGVGNRVALARMLGRHAAILWLAATIADDLS